MKIGKLLKVIFIAVAAAIAITSCQKEDSAPQDRSTRTVLVYMAGDNSLSDYVEDNITSMENGVRAAGVTGNRLLVLADDGSKNTPLYEITPQGRKVLKTYSTNINTADPAILKQVIADVKSLAAATSYGLVLWSHGSGWLPYNTTYGYLRGKMEAAATPAGAPFAIRPLPAGLYQTKSFAQEGNSSIDTDELADALPDKGFDFIIFDACYMASIELLYAIRSKADYIVAAPTEILASGFPYSDICKYLLGSPSNTLAEMKSVCSAYYSFYNGQSDASYRAATVSLINTSALDALAAKIRQLNLTTSGVDPNAVQRFNRQLNYPLFDFSDSYAAANGGITAWQNELSSVVVTSYYTPTFLDLAIKKCSGISTYIPLENAPLTNDAYMQTAWYKATTAK